MFAGSGKVGNTDGPAKTACFNHPQGITIDQKTGNLFVSDTNNNLIRQITPQGNKINLNYPKIIKI